VVVVVVVVTYIGQLKCIIMQLISKLIAFKLHLTFDIYSRVSLRTMTFNQGNYA